jgi:hypothetical protein
MVVRERMSFLYQLPLQIGNASKKEEGVWRYFQARMESKHGSLKYK